MPASPRAHLAVVLACCLPVAACGGGEETSPDAFPAPDRADARVIDPDPGAVISNLPGLDWQASPDSLPGFSIVSSNFVQENFGSGSVYQDWYAELRNDSGATVCIPQITLELSDASGAVRATMLAYPDTAPYDSGSTVSSTCMPPGTTAALWTIENPSSEAPLAQLTRASWSVSGLDSASFRPHPGAPTITGSVFEDTPGRWGVSGSLRATTDIYNIGVDVYPIGPDGWIVDRVSAINLGSVPSGTSWSYETSTWEADAPATYHQYASFIEGTGARIAAPTRGALAPAEAELQAAREVRRGLDQRRDAARAAAQR